MTIGERFNLFQFPAIVAAIALPLLAIAAYGLATLSIALFDRPQYLRQGISWMLFLAANCLAFGLLLVYPAHFFRTMRNRKEKTGSYLPTGEELIAFRRRKKTLSVSMRVLTGSCFSLIAFGITYKTFATAGHHSFAAWCVVFLFWLIALVFAVEAFWLRPERLWTGVLGAGAFGCLAVLTTAEIIRSGNPKSFAWLVPLFFGSFSASLAMITFRTFAKRERSVSENQTR